MKVHKLFVPLLALVAVVAVASSVPSGPAHAQSVGVCDQTTGSRCLAVNADGSINVSGTVGGSSGVVGNVASGAADSGSPVKTGCKYNATLPSFADGNRADCQSNIKGLHRVELGDVNGFMFSSMITSDATAGPNINFPVRSFCANYNGTTWDSCRGNTTGLAVLNGGIPANRWNYAAATSGIVNTTTAVTVKAAAGAGVRNCIADIEIDHDTLGAATEFVVNDGAAGTALLRVKLQTGANEGRTINLSSPVCGTANTLMEVKTVTAVTGGVYFSAQGYTVTP